jgi:hypothetical protein
VVSRFISYLAGIFGTRKPRLHVLLLNLVQSVISRTVYNRSHRLESIEYTTFSANLIEDSSI